MPIPYDVLNEISMRWRPGDLPPKTNRRIMTDVFPTATDWQAFCCVESHKTRVIADTGIAPKRCTARQQLDAKAYEMARDAYWGEQTLSELEMEFNK